MRLENEEDYDETEKAWLKAIFNQMSNHEQLDLWSEEEAIAFFADDADGGGADGAGGAGACRLTVRPPSAAMSLELSVRLPSGYPLSAAAEVASLEWHPSAGSGDGGDAVSKVAEPLLAAARTELVAVAMQACADRRRCCFSGWNSCARWRQRWMLR